MANEITLTGSLSAYKSTVMSSAIGRSFAGLLFNMTANVFSFGSVSVGFAAAEAIPLGEVTTPHWTFLVNKDSTNFVTVRNGLSGADLIQMYPGEPAIFPMRITATPYWLADTAACVCEFLVLGR